MKAPRPAQLHLRWENTFVREREIKRKQKKELVYQDHDKMINLETWVIIRTIITTT